MAVFQKQPPEVFYEKSNRIKKETLEQVISCEFCEISKNISTEHLWTTASSFCFSFFVLFVLFFSFKNQSLFLYIWVQKIS